MTGIAVSFTSEGPWISDPITKQYLIALATIVAGLAGWLLPDKYNVLKLKRQYAKDVSERTNILIARALGACSSCLVC